MTHFNWTLVQMGPNWRWDNKRLGSNLTLDISSLILSNPPKYVLNDKKICRCENRKRDAPNPWLPLASSWHYLHGLLCRGSITAAPIYHGDAGDTKTSWGNICKLSIIWAKLDAASPGPVLLHRSDAVERILANGSAAFIESCATVGWNSCDSVRSL